MADPGAVAVYRVAASGGGWRWQPPHASFPLHVCGGFRGKRQAVAEQREDWRGLGGGVAAAGPGAAPTRGAAMRGGR